MAAVPEIGKHVLKMNNGKSIPLLGLGTWLSPPDAVKEATKVAVKCGYRHIDTAIGYQNEAAIGDAIQELCEEKVVTRDELFITTKLPPAFMGAQTVKTACQASLKKLRVDTIDLFLIHLPMGMKYVDMDTTFPTDDSGNLIMENHDHVACWKAMEELVDEGLVHSIGISNFNSQQVERILKNCRIKPVTNQVECHVYFPQDELSAFHKQRDLFLTAYAPLGAPGRPDVMQKSEHAHPVIENPVIVNIAKKYNKTPAQVCLRSLIQRGLVVIPKSVTPQRILENSQIFDFELSDSDMTEIAGLKNGQRLFDGSLWGFTNVVSKWPGSVHDAFIWANCGIATQLEQKEGDGWILGDAGYALRPWLLTPKAEATTPAERAYNKSFKTTRCAVERAFGVLKSRFRCLDKSGGCLHYKPNKCCQIIVAVCQLHNLCINNNVPEPDILVTEDDSDDVIRYTGPVNDGKAVQDRLIATRFS